MCTESTIRISRIKELINKGRQCFTWLDDHGIEERELCIVSHVIEHCYEVANLTKQKGKSNEKDV